MNKAKMSHAPVYYVLAQIQFNPVSAMVKYVDEIQDILRRKGYTLFEPQEFTQLQFTMIDGQEAPKPALEKTNQWLITKADRSSGFILSKNGLVYHTTQYETHEHFFNSLIDGLKAVHEIVSLEHVNRIGLRYLDAVIPKAGEGVDEYLTDALHGIEFGAKRIQATNEFVFQTDIGPMIGKGVLVLRVHRLNQELGFPPDLAPNGLIVSEKFTNTGTISHAVLDTDHYVEGIMPLDFESIAAQLDSMYRIIRLSFETIVTPHAIKVWE